MGGGRGGAGGKEHGRILREMDSETHKLGLSKQETFSDFKEKFAFLGEGGGPFPNLWKEIWGSGFKV